MHIEQAVTRSLQGRGAELNEDATSVQADADLLAVADGTGGPGAGDVAASMAVLAIEGHLGALRAAAEEVAKSGSSGSRLKVGRLLERAFVDAHDKVLDATDTGSGGMDASLAALVVSGNHATVAHVGNCRAFLFRDGRIRRLTSDHTVAAERARSGRMSHREAADSPLRHRLTQSIGGPADLDVDLAEVALADGDRLLLCTDGLHEVVDETSMARALGLDGLDAAADRLMALALDHDDRSFVLARVRADADQAVLSEIAEVMSETFLFRELSERQRALVAPYLEHQFLDPGQVLFEEGEMGDTFYVVVDGTLRIRRGDVHLVDVGTGDHFGELCLARLARRSATVEAVSEALVFGLRRDRFQQIVQRRPIIGARIALSALDQLGDRVRDLTERLAEA